MRPRDCARKNYDRSESCIERNGYSIHFFPSVLIDVELILNVNAKSYPLRDNGLLMPKEGRVVSLERMLSAFAVWPDFFVKHFLPNMSELVSQINYSVVFRSA